MIFTANGMVHLTESERRELSQALSANGANIHVDQVMTLDEYTHALLSAMPDELIEDMSIFLETGTSPLMSEGRREQDSSLPNESAGESPSDDIQ
jgi:hypothetical protein